MDQNERNTGRSGWLIPLGLLVVPAVYLAALGPIHGLATSNSLPAFGYPVLSAVYYPLEWLDEQTDFFDSHPIGRRYVEYVEWFD